MQMKNRIIAILACLTLLTTAACGAAKDMNQSNNNTEIPPGVAVSPEVSAPEKGPEATSPTGMRKFIHFNGFRYAVLDNYFGLQGDNITVELADELGTISMDIRTDAEKYATTDFAGTFGIGEKVYSIKGYNKDFRVAVKVDDTIYVCQNVDNLDGSDVDLVEYFKTADLVNKISQIEVFDHFGEATLNIIPQDKATTLIETIATAKTMESTQENFERIGSMQSNGKSFLVVCNLTDGTTFNFYVIPEMNVVMIGDNTYNLSESFSNNFATYFENVDRDNITVN